jgi:hypothetical protein
MKSSSANTLRSWLMWLALSACVAPWALIAVDLGADKPAPGATAPASPKHFESPQSALDARAFLVVGAENWPFPGAHGPGS